jgi:hypothetical protein
MAVGMALVVQRPPALLMHLWLGASERPILFCLAGSCWVEFLSNIAGPPAPAPSGQTDEWLQCAGACKPGQGWVLGRLGGRTLPHIQLEQYTLLRRHLQPRTGSTHLLEAGCPAPLLTPMCDSNV